MSFLYPGEYIDSTYSIDFDKLYKEGYRGIIFDIDNTLVTHGSPADERAIALFKHLKELGFSCLVLSNNKEPRVKSFAKQVGISISTKQESPSHQAIVQQWRGLAQIRKTLFLWEIRYLQISSELILRHQINTCSTY